MNIKNMKGRTLLFCILTINMLAMNMHERLFTTEKSNLTVIYLHSCTPHTAFLEYTWIVTLSFIQVVIHVLKVHNRVARQKKHFHFQKSELEAIRAASNLLSTYVQVSASSQVAKGISYSEHHRNLHAHWEGNKYCHPYSYLFVLQLLVNGVYGI